MQATSGLAAHVTWKLNELGNIIGEAFRRYIIRTFECQNSSLENEFVNTDSNGLF